MTTASMPVFLYSMALYHDECEQCSRLQSYVLYAAVAVICAICPFCLCMGKRNHMVVWSCLLIEITAVMHAA